MSVVLDTNFTVITLTFESYRVRKYLCWLDSSIQRLVAESHAGRRAHLCYAYFTDKYSATFSSLSHQKLYRASTETTKTSAAVAVIIICNFSQVNDCFDC